MDSHEQRARDIVGWYTLAATGAGAVPVPASSLAIMANNGFMIAHVSAVMGATVTWRSVTESVGIAGSLNVMGRTVFVEAAKTLSWGTGSWWALVGLSAAGAATAGLQTYVIGLLAIEIAKRDGAPLSPEASSDVLDRAKRTYDEFVAEMTRKKVKDPGPPPVVQGDESNDPLTVESQDKTGDGTSKDKK